MLRRLALAAALCLLLPALIGCEKRIREASVESTPAALNPVWRPATSAEQRIDSLKKVAEPRTKAFGSLREVAEPRTKAFECLREAFDSLEEVSGRLGEVCDSHKKACDRLKEA